MKGTSCEECAYFEYDEEEESYGCQFYFDEDDIAIFVRIFSTKMSIELLESKFRSIKNIDKMEDVY